MESLPLSLLPANVALHPLDVARREGRFGRVRYADDFVIFAQTRERAEEAFQVVRSTLEGLHLRRHPENTRVVTLDKGFGFLGYHYFRKARLDPIRGRQRQGYFGRVGPRRTRLPWRRRRR